MTPYSWGTEKVNEELGKGREKQENSVFFSTAAVAGERAVWMLFSQYVDVFLRHNILRRDTAGGRRGGNGSFSGKRPVPGLGLCLLFLLKCLDWEYANLYFCDSSFSPWGFLINFLFFLFFLIIVKTGSLDCFSLVSHSLFFFLSWWILDMN